MDNTFQIYRNEYFLSNTTEERKEELRTLMRENLKLRCGSNSNVNIESKEISLDSDNVEDLLAIDGFLNKSASTNLMTELGNSSRFEAQSQNRYSPTNPYPNN